MSPGPCGMPGAGEPVHQLEEEVAGPAAVSRLPALRVGAVQVPIPGAVPQPRGAGSRGAALVAEVVVRMSGDGRAPAEVESVRGHRPDLRQRLHPDLSPG